MLQAVILAGGLGTRISEESHLKPKPMIEIGGKPILWHIMKTYAHYGITDFIVCCGYKGYVIKEYFANYFLHMSDITFDLADNQMQIHRKNTDSWKVTLIDTGEHTLTGGRVKRVSDYINGRFCLTYGDGVSDVNIAELLAFHEKEGREATITAIQPAGRFGSLVIDGTKITDFIEKPKGDNKWVNGGFMVCEPSLIDRVIGDETILEQEPLMGLAHDGELSVFKHHGFWAAMDTLRDRNHLEELWAGGDAPWKVWS
mgnify:CR=1 FL=1|jgi:glucose-1-phosphate cytidylyltransferase